MTVWAFQRMHLKMRSRKPIGNYLKIYPDINKEPGAEEKYKEVQEAYETLSDEQKRAAYDQYGAAGANGGFGGGAGGFGGFDGAGFGGFEDIFSSFFGGGASRNPNAPRQG